MPPTHMTSTHTSVRLNTRNCLLNYSVCTVLKFTELDYTTFEGSEKQSNGRMPKLKITLFDIDTGFGEDTVITGEGIDKGDKAGYKAYTGALKYYLANTFMVATGDDPEEESPSNRMNTVTSERKASDRQIVSRIEDLPMKTASAIISKLMEN